jgi:aspartyl-tRNA(Asn)/glutamyl-tRNA(Gln) amidotransferase subunit B
MELETIIGLEVHVQLKTASKMFCRCDNRDDQAPNTAICHICTAQPGALPLPNGQAINWAVMASLALGCQINQESKFDRKSYFYPDLPKGYQISQYDKPFGHDGQITIPVDGTKKTFRINRLHLEEDAGKLLHQGTVTLVDLNRAGTPLMEIVSEPDFRSPAEAKAYVQELRLIMRYLGVSDADMEKGHLRCDANISLRPQGSDELYPKTEIKNINSFRAIERALAFEVHRQTALWEDGTPPTQQATRGWDENSQTTVEQRTKEEAADYRYFPEPDIPPIVLTDEHMLNLKAQIPELPSLRRERFMTMFTLSAEASIALVEDKELADYFEHVVSEFREYAANEIGAEAAAKLWTHEKGKDVALIANWLLNKISAEHRAAHGLPVPAQDVGRLLWMLHQSTINAPAAVQIYDQMVLTKKGPHTLVKELGLEQVSDMGQLETIIAEVLAANEKVVADVKAGKAAGVQFIVGQVMKATKGKANPKLVQEALQKLLAS